MKKNSCYGFTSYTKRSSGLFNSTRFISESLNSRGITSETIEVNDNNDIDRNVKRFKPNIVVIEALWVVPEKFHILKRLHPKVKWFVHLHSHIPFLALEGIAMNWIKRYVRESNVGIIANSEESFEALKPIIEEKNAMVYLPNVYISNPMPAKSFNYRERKTIHIGCYGAVRPMKNHLLQALAAIKFAQENDLRLKFHINGSRVEVGGSPVLKNLRQLFELQRHAELIEEPWMEHEDFLKRLHYHIDIGMQVSMSETFSVVSADYVTAGVPMVVSKEIYWASRFSKAKDNDINSIVDAMKRAWSSKYLIWKNQRLLCSFSEMAQEKWHNWVLNGCK